MKDREDLVYEFKDMLKKTDPACCWSRSTSSSKTPVEIVLDPPDITKQFMKAIE
ncbi:MAG: hypothetical protein U0361_13795 [Nitrospiraceae bacterium]